MRCLTASVILCVASCIPPGSYAPPASSGQPIAPQPTPGPEPAPDTRNEGQIIVDILASQNYQCAAEETRWRCVPPDGIWALYVSYVATDNPATIWFDSFENRAFARPCPQFTNAMKDLANGTDYIVSCDDGSQQFRFNTYFSYGPGLDVMVWARAHESLRANSIKLLNSIHAIRK